MSSTPVQELNEIYHKSVRTSHSLLSCFPVFELEHASGDLRFVATMTIQSQQTPVKLRPRSFSSCDSQREAMLTTAKSEAPGDRSSQSCIEPLTTLKNRKVSCLLIAAFEWVTLLPPVRVDGHATAVIWTSADRVTGTLLCDFPHFRNSGNMGKNSVGSTSSS